MFYNYVKFFMFYIAEGDGKVHGTHPKLKKAYTNNIFFEHGVPRFRGSLPMRSIEQGSGSSIYSLKEDVLNKVRLS